MWSGNPTTEKKAKKLRVGQKDVEKERKLKGRERKALPLKMWHVLCVPIFICGPKNRIYISCMLVRRIAPIFGTEEGCDSFSYR